MRMILVTLGTALTLVGVGITVILITSILITSIRFEVGFGMLFVSVLMMFAGVKLVDVGLRKKVVKLK